MSAIDPLVYVVDDDAMVRKALLRLLGSAGWRATAFESARAFLDGHDRAAPGCVVLDLAMPGLDGLAVQGALAAGDSDLPIIFLTGEGDVPSSVRAMKRGAMDFLTKPADDQELLAAVGKAIERNARWQAARAERESFRARMALLTPRERDVMLRIVEGKLNKQVAAELGTVEKTIKVHRARIMAKMQVRTLAALVRLVERSGAALPQPG